MKECLSRAQINFLVRKDDPPLPSPPTPYSLHQVDPSTVCSCVYPNCPVPVRVPRCRATQSRGAGPPRGTAAHSSKARRSRAPRTFSARPSRTG